MSKKTIVVVGLGGVGFYLVPPLVRYYAHQTEEEVDIVLVDGDIIEQHNTSRVFDGSEVGLMKGEVMGMKANDLLPDDSRVKIYSVNEYVTPTNNRVHKFWMKRDNLTILSCVDNHPSRLYLQSLIQASNSGAIIAAGNDYFDGDILTFVRRNGVNVVPPLEEQFPELLEKSPENSFPDDLDCLAQAVSTPQLVLANFASAFGVLGVMYQLEKDPDSFKLSRSHFDLQRGAYMMPVDPTDFSDAEDCGYIKITVATETTLPAEAVEA